MPVLNRLFLRRHICVKKRGHKTKPRLRGAGVNSDHLSLESFRSRRFNDFAYEYYLLNSFFPISSKGREYQLKYISPLLEQLYTNLFIFNSCSLRGYYFYNTQICFLFVGVLCHSRVQSLFAGGIFTVNSQFVCDDRLGTTIFFFFQTCQSTNNIRFRWIHVSKESPFYYFSTCYTR